MATSKNVDIQSNGIALKQNDAQLNKIYEAQMKRQAKHNLEMQRINNEAIAESIRQQAKLKGDELEKEKARYKELLDEQAKLEGEYAEMSLSARKKAAVAACRFELNQYMNMTQQQKREYQLQNLDQLAQQKRTSDARLRLLKKQLQNETDEEKKSRIQQKIDKESEKNTLTKKAIQTSEAIATSAAPSEKFADFVNGTSKVSDRRREVATKRVESAEINLSKVKEKLQKEEEKHLNKQKKNNDALQKAKQKGDTTEIARIKKLMEAEDERYKKSLENNEELEAAEQELADAKKQQTEEELKGAASKALSSAVSKVSDSISSNMDAIYGDQGRMMGRLQGSGVWWNKSILDVTTSVGISGVVSQKDVVKKMVDLVDSGVAYNLEMRAFLGEISENIASTFDATNGTLLRLIRIQQQDTTAARLGMEATLTNLFNKYFQDTSYLTSSGPSDSVAQTLLDASAFMDRDQYIEFEFAVQKWLGSLYSLGMSSEAVQKLAQGVVYMSTGNYGAMANDTSLQHIFSMGATRAGGKSYSDMLKQGIDASDTNKLLKSIIEYLAEIASTQENNVTKSAYAELLGMSVSDLSLFTSLKSEEIKNLYKTTKTYDDLYNEVQSQAWKTLTRLSIAQMLGTVIDNAEVGAAATIGSNPVTYGLWKATAILKDYVGEIKIPGVTGMGTGIASGLDILNLAQTAIAGFGLLGSLVSGVASMLQGGALNLKQWDFKESTSRGSSLKLLSIGAEESTSVSAVLGTGSGSGSDIESTTMESGKQSAYESGETSEEEMDEQKELPKKIYDALNGETTPTVLSTLLNIESLLKPERVFYTAITGAMSSSVTAASLSVAENGMLQSKMSSSVNSSADSSTGTSSANNTSDKITSMEDIVYNAISKFFTSEVLNVDVRTMPTTAQGGV
jgi:hypothetical protein